MLHQIRKMVGLTLAIIRGHTDEEVFAKSFTKEKVNVPRAPGLGLVLDFVHYVRYNNRYGNDHDKLEWVEEEEMVNAFKEKYIYPTIVNTEIKEKSMMEWLTCLLIHRYDIPEGEEVNDDDDEEEEGAESGDDEVKQDVENVEKSNVDKEKE